MDTKIQELADKLFQEGVEKGSQKASKIVEDAESQKQAILQSAKEEAEQIIATAQKEAAELKKNTEAELKLFASQSVESLKSEVANLITGEVVNQNIKAATEDPKFMQQVILTLAQNWSQEGSVTIQTKDAESLKDYFLSNAKDLISKGLKVEQVNGKDAAFTILPADGSYKVNFGEEEFIAYFKEFLRPQLIDMLF